MNKKLVLVLLISMFFLLTSCSNYGIAVFTKETSDKFVDKVYEEINTENAKYKMIDLRKTEQYLEKHVKQFENYDYKSSNYNDFITYLMNQVPKNTTIYLYTEEEIEDKLFLSELINVATKKKANIYILKTDFESLEKNERLVFVSGEYDCGC